MRKILPERWSNNHSVDYADHPPTFGAADQRPKRRSFGTSLLESTFDRSRNSAVNGAEMDDLDIRRDNEIHTTVSETRSYDVEKGHKVHVQNEIV